MRPASYVPAAAAVLLAGAPVSIPAALGQAAVSAPPPTYADLADLTDSADLVARVQVRKLARVKNERAPGLKRGEGRFYIEARTQALLAGSSAVGEKLAYLVDLPLDERGRPPAIKKQEVLVFARPVPDRSGELQLVTPGAQVAHDPVIEATVRSILTEKLSADAPGRVTGVSEIIHVQGNLAGEGETQVFLKTADGSAASVTVRHVPGQRPQWGASFSELVADVGNPPRRDTLAWYRLACFLPNALPPGANISATPATRAQATADYRMVLGELGLCQRNLS